MRKILFAIIVWVCLPVRGNEALTSLLERISPGLSQRIKVELTADSVDYFEIGAENGMLKVSGNSVVNVATGVHNYLKKYCGVHVSWNNLRPEIPSVLPLPEKTERFSTPLKNRYYLNYCTHSYSMAFWDWERWENEIDWMALHGVNMPLAITGMEAVWERTMKRMGYDDEQVKEFIAGGAFKAWWLMNNLEGWGGKVSREYIDGQMNLQKRILKRMRELGMEPVLAGYSGMVPHDADSVCGLKIADSGKWLGYTRPAFLQPTDERFDEIAGIYYEELNGLYGRAKYYSMDPFHEGGNTAGVNLAEAARKIYGAMQKCAPGSVWVLQGWQENPRSEILDALPKGSLAVLDLQAENEPMWEKREGGFRGHDRLHCMLLNFGGNVGLYGKTDALLSGFARARRGEGMIGTGMTMEGIENNPVMFELFCDLPWKEITDKDAWVEEYVKARYGGVRSEKAIEAWRLLMRSVYNSPADSMQQGTTESVFCARPSDNPRNVSAWANAKRYYDAEDVIRAAEMLGGAERELGANRNFRYDYSDVRRQANAEEGRRIADRLADAKSREEYAALADSFMALMARQDSLLSEQEGFRLEEWLNGAERSATTDYDREREIMNALRQITTWGLREASENGRLHDYAHREWGGLIKDFYMPRWRKWFDERLRLWDSGRMPEIDFYAYESELIGKIASARLNKRAD